MNQMRRKERPKLPEDKRARMKKEVIQYKQIKLSDITENISQKCGNTKFAKYGTQSNNGDVVIFLPMATKEFETMVYWGEYHPVNRDEQIYEGIGHIFMDGNRRIVVVSHFLYIYAAERTPTSACIMNGTFNSVMTRIEYEVDIYNKNEVKYNVRKDGTLLNPVVGIAGPSRPVLYGHTHPNLGCFFSPPDRVSGFATPDFPAVTFVADPIRKEMKAGVGVELSDAEILVYSYESDSKVAKDEIRTFSTKKTTDAEPLRIRSAKPVKTDELIAEVSRDCSELLNPLHGAKGKFTSRTTITGAQKIKMEMTWKPVKKDMKKATVDAGVVGKTYDSYA